MSGQDADEAQPPPSERWLAQGSAVSSGELTRRIARDPAVQEVQRLAPDLTVLLATPDIAAALQADFQDSLVLERDAALEPPG